MTRHSSRRHTHLCIAVAANVISWLAGLGFVVEFFTLFGHWFGVFDAIHSHSSKFSFFLSLSFLSLRIFFCDSVIIYVTPLYENTCALYEVQEHSLAAGASC